MQPVERSDKVLPETRWVAAVIIPFLIAALLILLLVPTRTGELFAWKLQPTMSAMMLGSAYAGGVVFFAFVLAAREWHRVKAGFLPVTVFATLLGIATIIHWDRFDHSHVAFYAWAGLYFTTPLIVLAVWLRNRGLDPRSAAPDDQVVPRWLRIAFGVVGVIALAIAAAMFVAPAALIPVWPWTLTPLTARVVSAMFALPGMVGLGLSLEPRWSAWRILLLAQGFSILLILIGIARAWSEFDRPDAGKWILAAGLALMFAGIVAVYLWMSFRREAAATRPRLVSGQGR